MRPVVVTVAVVMLAGTAFAQPTPTPGVVRGATGRVGGAPPPESAQKPKNDEQPQVDQDQGQKTESSAQKAIRFAVGWNADRAKEALAAVPEDARSGADYRIARALAPMAEGKLDDALNATTQVAKDFPSAPAPEYYRGEILYWKGKVKDAEGAWKAAATRAQAEREKQPKNGWASYYLGAAKLQLRDFAAAKTALEAALANGASKPLVNYQLGLLAGAQQRWQDAVDLFTAALTEDSGLAYAYYYRGLSWSKLKKTDQLLLDMDRFLTLAPESPDAIKARSILASTRR